MTARVSTNTYCLARTRRFSRRSEKSVGRVTHEREASTDTVRVINHVTTVKSRPSLGVVCIKEFRWGASAEVD